MSALATIDEAPPADHVIAALTPEPNITMAAETSRITLSVLPSF